MTMSSHPTAETEATVSHIDGTTAGTISVTALTQEVSSIAMESTGNEAAAQQIESEEQTRAIRKSAEEQEEEATGRRDPSELDSYIQHFGGGGDEVIWQAAAEIFMKDEEAENQQQPPAAEEEGDRGSELQPVTYRLPTNNTEGQQSHISKNRELDQGAGNVSANENDDQDDLGSHSSQEETPTADNDHEHEGYMYMGLISGTHVEGKGMEEYEDDDKESFGSLQSGGSEDFEDETEIPYYTLGEEPLITPSADELAAEYNSAAACASVAASMEEQQAAKHDASNQGADEAPAEQDPSCRHEIQVEEEHFDPFENDIPSSAWNPPMSEEKLEKIKGIMANFPPPAEAYKPSIDMTVAAVKKRAQKSHGGALASNK